MKGSHPDVGHARVTPRVLRARVTLVGAKKSRIERLQLGYLVVHFRQQVFARGGRLVGVHATNRFRAPSLQIWKVRNRGIDM